jgi:DNA-binding NarL/FixJ family response regulator
MPSPRVLLADDHKILAQGLQLILGDAFTFVGTVADGHALVEAAVRLKPDVVVTDISMPVLNGLDAVRQFRSKGVEAKVVFLTMHADPTLAAEAFRAGGSAFLLKDSAGEELVQAIREILQGRVYLTPRIAKDMISVLMEAKGERTEENKLTNRQREVLQLIAEGKTMKEVAGILNISPRTAETHKYEMMQVLAVKTTAELIQHAIRLRLVNVERRLDAGGVA